MKVKAILTKPLDGYPEGTEREFDEDDFRQLAAYGAVRRADHAQKKAETPAASKPARATTRKAAD